MAIKERCEGTYYCSDNSLLGDEYKVYYDRSCRTIQNYCTINGQKAIDNIPTIVDNFPSFLSGSFLNSTDFNQIPSLLNQIYNFGAGSPTINQIRTPDGSNFIQAIQNEKTLLTQYNTLLSILGENTVSSNLKMSSTAMEEIKNYIKNYEIDESRCFVCNANKNCPGQGASCGESSGSGDDDEGGCGCWCQCGNCTGCESGWH